MTFTFVDVPFDNLDANPVNKDGVRFYKIPDADKYNPSAVSNTL